LCLGACSKAEEQSAELAKELERARQEAECEKEVAEECARAAEEEKAAADLETAREESKATAADLRAQIETQRHALQERSADVQRAEAQAEDLSLNLRIAHNSLKKASEAEEALKERVAGLEAEVKAAQMKADFLNFSLQKQEKAGRELTAKLEAQRRDAETVRTHHHALQQEAAVLRASLLTEPQHSTPNERSGERSLRQHRRASGSWRNIWPPRTSKSTVWRRSFASDTTDPDLADYTLESQRRTEQQITDLFGRVSVLPGDGFDTEATHVVQAPRSYTMKCLAALLMGKWVVNVQWVRDSHVAREWLPEAPYGYRGNKDILKDKRVFLSKKFVRMTEAYEFLMDWTVSLVQTYGRCRLVDTLESCDFVLMGPGDTRSQFAPKRTYTWNMLLKVIYPVPGRRRAPPAPVPSAANPASGPSSSSDGH